MRIFVTGGTGFIGSHFLKHALAAGHEVIALRRPGSSPRISLSQQPKWVVGDLETDCTQYLDGCDALVHLASYGVSAGMSDWKECFHWNVEASLAFWMQAASSNVKKFLICGSCFEYGRSGERYSLIPPDAPLEPTGAYHSSKAAATMAAVGLAIDKHLSLLILRPFHVYGEGEDERRFWPSLKKAALEGKPFKMTKGEQIRDFTPVEHIVSTLLLALSRSDVTLGHPKIENMGTGKPISLKDFALREWKRLGATGAIEIGQVPARPNEVMSYVPKL